MMPPKKSAHAELDQLRRDVADDRVTVRDLEAQLEAAKAKVEQAGAAIADAYASEDQRAVTASRKGEEEAVGEVKELERHLIGAVLRVERAQQQADAFSQQHARALLEERAADARELALKTTRAGHELVRAAPGLLRDAHRRRRVGRSCAGRRPPRPMALCPSMRGSAN